MNVRVPEQSQGPFLARRRHRARLVTAFMLLSKRTPVTMPLKLAHQSTKSRPKAPAPESAPGPTVDDGALPDRLAHYTILGGFQGILGQGQFWASNVSFLNDSRELLHGLEASVQALKALSSTARTAPWLKSLRRASKRLFDGEMPNTYAVCFCGSSDVLSQWRGYGGSEQGVAMVFDRKALAARMAEKKAELFPVVYGKVKSKSIISKSLDQELALLSKSAETMRLSDESRDAEAYRLMCRLLPQFNHYGFRDERELRFVVQQEKVRASVCFRPASNVLIPYLKLLDPDAGLLPLTSVIVGPGRDQKPDTPQPRDISQT